MASILDLVKRFQSVIENYPHDEHKVLKSIDKLYNLGVTVQHLQETGIGRTVNALRKEPGDIGNAAKALVNKWKLMVASEESSDPEDHEAPKYNGHGNGRDSDDIHHQSRQSNGLNSSSASMHSSQTYQHTNGDLNAGKRRALVNEQELSSKKPRHSDEIPTDIINRKERYSDSDHKISEAHTDDSDCSTLSSDKDHKLKQEITKSIDYHEPSTSKQSNYEYNKKEESNSKKTHEHRSNSESHHDHKSSKQEKISSSHKNKDLKEKESSSKRDTTAHHSEKSLPNKLTSSDRHRSSSKKEERSSDKSKSHSEKRESKSDSKDSSQKHKSDKDKHKSSSDKKSRTKHSEEHSSKDDSSSRKEKSHHKETSKHLSSSKSRKEGSDKSGERKDSKKASSSSKSSRSKDGEPKKKSQTNSEDSEEGVDCQSGASFAEALGMVSPAKSKKKSKFASKEFPSPSNSFIDDQGPAALLAPSAKLAPLLPLEIMALPEISPHYKPRPPPKLLPHFSDDDAISAGISSKNQRTKVYSGNKTYGKLPTLSELCVTVLQEHIDALEYTGGVPYDILKPVIDKATPNQLFLLEHYNPYLIEDTNHLWQKFCEKYFRAGKRKEMETWRELFLRCQEEQEVKLRSLTENIKIAQEAKKAPIKQTKMAYVDSVVKPPRNIARKQAQHGTGRLVSASPAARVASLATTPNVGRAGAVAVKPVIAPSSSLSALNRPRKAPLMQKALQLMRGGRKK